MAVTMVHVRAEPAPDAGRPVEKAERPHSGVQTLGPPPLEVQAVLAAGIRSRRFLFPDAGPARAVESWEPPVISDKKLGAAIWLRLEALEQFTQPAGRGEIMSRILVLLSHYRQAGNSHEVEQGIADDWAEDLGYYPIWAIDAAARQWRRTQRFKPQISEMIELCNEACSETLKERDRLRSIVAATQNAQNTMAVKTQTLIRALFNVNPMDV